MRAAGGPARLVALCALGCALALGAAAAEELEIEFRDADLQAVVAALARETGLRLIYDASLQGRLTVALEDRVSDEEALELLNAALLLNGFGLAPGPEGVHKVLPLQGAQAAAPWLGAVRGERPERLVLTMLRLEAADASEIARALEPLSGDGIVQPYARTNSLILGTTEGRLQRLLSLVRALDEGISTRLRVLPLRYADATEVAGQLAEAFPRDEPDRAPYRVIVDERTNSLILEGPSDLLEALLRFTATVDVPAAGRGVLQVVRVRNVDAEVLAQQLQALGGPEGAALSASDYQVTPDPPTNSLVIRAAPDAFLALAELIAELDRVPPRVEVELLLLQVETSGNLRLGLDAFLPLLVPDDPGDAAAFVALQNATELIDSTASGEPFFARFAREPLVVPIILPDGTPSSLVVPEAAVQVTAASGQAAFKTLLRPRLLTASGEEARIFTGDNVPIPVASATDPAGILRTSTSIERRDVGIDLRLTANAVSDELVELDLDVSVTSVVPAATGGATAPPGAGPIISRAAFTARVRLPDGAVAVVASSPQITLQQIESGVPWLRSIPVLGNLFRQTAKLQRDTRIVAAVQATVIDSPEEQEAASLQQRLAFERRLARIHPLVAASDAPYAILVSSEPSREEAERVAAGLAGLPGAPTVVEWSWRDELSFDVYLAGFHEIAPLGPLAIRLRERGFQPRISVVTERLR